MLMKKGYQEYIDRLKSQGKPIATYICPNCGEQIETLKPDNTDDIYDSSTICPHCGGLHFKKVFPDGSVDVADLGGGVP